MQIRRCAALLSGLLAGLVLASSASAATIAVTTTADDLTPNDGSVSLREAISAINAGNDIGDPDIVGQGPGTFGSGDTIDFSIAGSGPRRILVGGGSNVGGLPSVARPVLIDGTSQPGSAANTLANADNATTRVLLDGSSAGPNASGLFLGPGAAGSTIRGLDLFGFGGGDIAIQSNLDTVAGNDIGFDLTGAPAASPRGVLIQSSADNTIGGTTPASRNVISGNSVDGVDIFGSANLPATANVVEGNFIGTGPTGTSALGNGTGAPAGAGGGVELVDANGNMIGGAPAGARNVISGNAVAGVLDNGGQSNAVHGNFIGVGADGVTKLPNAAGVWLTSTATGPAAQNNVVGGTGAGSGNLIVFNTGGGVVVNGAGTSGNAILGNSIGANGGLGIDLGDDGVTPNSSGGPHTGPNHLQNFPVITAVSRGQSTTTIQGTLNATPSKTFRLEFFSSTACDQSGFGQGLTFLGFASVPTDASGNASYSVSLAGVVATGASVAATATDPTNDTSEFSRCFPPPAGKATTTTTTTPPPATGPTKHPVTPNSSFSAIGTPRVNTTTGAITFTEAVADPGTFSWLLTFPNGPFGVFAATGPKRCAAHQVKLKHRCRPSTIVYGKGSMVVAAPGRVIFTVTPTPAGASALRNALRHHRALTVAAALSFQSARGGAPVSRTQTITVKLKKAKKRKK